ncbi:2OG-Fe(II) oxygenase [Marivibrio halodurans]|uniref:2OG-Fe(II) oxygenase n=1 Tax=Marivibrio halodurans TaxID=2039722 RepID=A0A8J7V1T4_9PROT|nr:2OG-Fe(II) oxygenase [Marivibrio halodurans]MBP5856436.1 2OG-Fe(II) oxygenase [Marivibrio halodurans]
MSDIDFTRPEAVIDLARYPLDRPKDPGLVETVKRLRAKLDRDQYCELPHFITEAARLRAIADANAALPMGHDNSARRNCYLQRAADPDLPADHPRNMMLEASTRMLAADLLPADSPLKTLYYWEPTRRLIAAIVGEETLYVNEDPMQPVNTVCYRDGDRSAWHFDSVNAFTMTLMLQEPESGGDFQIWPNTRADDDQCYDRVARVLKGEADDGIRTVAREAGALCLFRGCNSLHRVSPVRGDRLRVMGVFVYETEPGVIGDPQVNETVYGAREPRMTVG